MVNICLVGPIAATEADRQIYLGVVRELGRLGTVSTRLGEQRRGLGWTDEEACDLHDGSVARVQEADVLVAEVTAPSCDAGYLTGRAVEYGIPTILIYRPAMGRQFPSTLLRVPNAHIVHYKHPTDLPDRLAPILAAIEPQPA